MRAKLQPRDARDRLIVALDVPERRRRRARSLPTLGDCASFYKIGMQLVFAGGLALIEELSGRRTSASSST